MKPRTRIPARRRKPRRIHPERSGGHLRVRLHGPERVKRRAEIFERAGGRCEEKILVPRFEWSAKEDSIVEIRCPNPATEWSHRRHGSNKCDCLNPNCSIASCQGCHEKIHRPKACPAKPKKVSVA